MTGQTIRVHTILRFVFVAFLSISLFIYFAVVSHRSHTLDVSCILSILFLRFCPVSIYLLLFCLCGNERSIVRVFSNVIELSRRAEQRRYGNNIHTKANSIHVQPRMVGGRWVDAQSVGCCCRRRYRWCIHAHTQSTQTGTGTVYLHSLLDKNRKESNGKWCLSNWLGSLASRVLLVFLFRISVCLFVCVWLCSPCSECLELELQLRMGDTNRINYRLNLLVITIIVGTHTHTEWSSTLTCQCMASPITLCLLWWTLTVFVVVVFVARLAFTYSSKCIWERSRSISLAVPCPRREMGTQRVRVHARRLLIFRFTIASLSGRSLLLSYFGENANRSLSFACPPVSLSSTGWRLININLLSFTSN